MSMSSPLEAPAITPLTVRIIGYLIRFGQYTCATPFSWNCVTRRVRVHHFREAPVQISGWYMSMGLTTLVLMGSWLAGLVLLKHQSADLSNFLVVLQLSYMSGDIFFWLMHQNVVVRPGELARALNQCLAFYEGDFSGRDYPLLRYNYHYHHHRRRTPAHNHSKVDVFLALFLFGGANLPGLAVLMYWSSCHLHWAAGVGLTHVCSVHLGNYVHGFKFAVEGESWIPELVVSWTWTWVELGWFGVYSFAQWYFILTAVSVGFVYLAFPVPYIIYVHHILASYQKMVVEHHPDFNLPKFVKSFQILRVLQTNIVSAIGPYLLASTIFVLGFMLIVIINLLFRGNYELAFGLSCGIYVIGNITYFAIVFRQCCWTRYKSKVLLHAVSARCKGKKRRATLKALAPITASFGSFGELSKDLYSFLMGNLILYLINSLIF